MVDLVGIRYVRMGTADVDKAVEIATDIIGLELVARENGCAYLRGDDRDHNICYFQGDPADHTVGFEVETGDQLDATISALEASGHPVRRGTPDEAARRRVMDFVNFHDPSGNSIDIVLRPYHSGRRYFPSRDAGIEEFSHIGLNSTNPPRDEEFWGTLFNFKANDWIATSGLLSFDDVHHRVALFPSDQPGVQHINFQMHSIDDVQRAHYFMRDHQVKIRFGPGRHPLSGAMFLYFDGPDQMIYEYSHGVMLLNENPEHRARQFPWEHWSLCMWGALPDISQFET